MKRNVVKQNTFLVSLVLALFLYTQIRADSSTKTIGVSIPALSPAAAPLHSPLKNTSTTAAINSKTILSSTLVTAPNTVSKTFAGAITTSTPGTTQPQTTDTTLTAAHKMSTTSSTTSPVLSNITAQLITQTPSSSLKKTTTTTTANTYATQTATTVSTGKSTPSTATTVVTTAPSTTTASPTTSSASTKKNSTTTIKPIVITTPTKKPTITTPVTPAIATTANPLAALQTGNTYSFGNIMLTEHLDLSGIYFYSGMFTSTNQTDYFVVMPPYLYNTAIDLADGPYPAYNPSTPQLLIPGQKIDKTYTVPTASSAQGATPAGTQTPEVQTVSYAISLLSGNCYSFQGTFTPQQSPTSSTVIQKSFINPNILTSLSNTSFTVPQGPFTNFFAIYVPYPNFTGRLSQPISNNINNAITAFNTAANGANTGNSMNNVPSAISAAVPLTQIPTAATPGATSTTTSSSTKTATLPVYTLGNIALTEFADPSGVIVYAGSFTQAFPENFGYKGTDYFIMTTQYQFSKITSTGSYPIYTYADPEQPLLFPGQQITKTYTVPAPPAPPAQTIDGFKIQNVLSTTNTTQPVTVAISLVTGNCYQLMYNNQVWNGSQTLNILLPNPSFTLTPLLGPTTTVASKTGKSTPANQVLQNFYGLYAPYDNYSGPLSPTLVSLVTAFLTAEKVEEATIETGTSPISTPSSTATFKPTTPVGGTPAATQTLSTQTQAPASAPLDSVTSTVGSYGSSPVQSSYNNNSFGGSSSSSESSFSQGAPATGGSFNASSNFQGTSPVEGASSFTPSQNFSGTSSNGGFNASPASNSTSFTSNQTSNTSSPFSAPSSFSTNPPLEQSNPNTTSQPATPEPVLKFSVTSGQGDPLIFN